ncbi:MAG: heme lyase CcmF/NrfE family subunit [Magnetococcales bacterium]|nr:heme lyase CcmF/NrfE family subunit [Magnetococcales bacterium]NGZ26310.1 heme lyase CcmF/NrfE family subunit [Magnetococcales bacterium]
MWIELGHFSTILALILTLVQWVSPLVGVASGRPVWIRVGRQAAFATFILLTIASGCLITSFMIHDFTVKYVTNHASLKLPVFYLATAMWGGHEGSLLLWAWLLSLYIAVAAWRHWATHPLSMPWILAITAALLTGFLLLILFLSSPFDRMFPAPPDGRDLNPLLQDPGMVFHPPFLYMGYVGFAIPFAFAMAALITGRTGEEWILATRRWTLFSWAMLTTGIVFGAYWAYYELGWGGYWAWDPVENASFMPWLTGTAFLHSIMVQERRQMFKTWNLFLITTTFALSLLGTFLVRSGVLSSVHAFASDPGKGVYILVFMSVVLLFSFGLLIVRSDLVQTKVQMESMLSRESTFLFNNLFLVVGTTTVLLGTLYPLAVETFSTAKVSVGAPYYNKVFIPIMLGLLILMGIGPLIPWRSSQWATTLKRFTLPAVLAVVGVVVAIVLNVNHTYGVITVALIFFVLTTHLQDVFSGTRLRMQKEGTNPLVALMALINRNKRRYGGLIVHLGVLIMAAGFIGSGLFQEERTLVMKVGDGVRNGSWHLTLQSIAPTAKRNWTATEATFVAKKDGGEEAILKTQKRVYSEFQQPTSEAAIHSTFWEDLYVVLGDPVGDGFSFRVYRNPLVGWVWWGSGVMAVGAFIALLQGRRLSRRQRVVAQGAAA